MENTALTFFDWMCGTSERSLNEYFEIVAVDNKNSTVLIGAGPTLISVLKINGAKILIGTEEFNYIRDGLMHSLQSTMSNGWHSMQAYFYYNRDEARTEIIDVFAPARQTAQYLSLSLDDIFDERVEYLSRCCAHEDVFIVLFTHDFYASPLVLRSKHDVFVRLVQKDMDALGVSLRMLEAREALYEMRHSVDTSLANNNQEFILAEDKIAVKDLKNFTKKISDIVFPSLAQQLTPHDLAAQDLNTVCIGDYIYSSVFIHLLPKNIMRFSVLLSHILPAQIPWRISFLIEGGGLKAEKLKASLASTLKIPLGQNRSVGNAENLLSEYIKLHPNSVAVGLRVTACTWAQKDDVELLRTRVSELTKAIENWGLCDASEVSGDAFSGAASSAMGVSCCSSVASPLITTLLRVLHMLPLFRPSSPWDKGAILFHSSDGKPWPYQPGSDEQAAWIDLIYSHSGFEKSVLSNIINLAVCLKNGTENIPRLSIIDIESSNNSLIALIKEALPSDKKYLAAYYRISLASEASEFAINPFDTQLGCRYPTPQEYNFLINFLELISASKISEAAIEELYKKTADDGKPNIYVPGVSIAVDNALAKINFTKSDNTTWWNITDSLFLSGCIHEARIAQRYAVPVLAEAISACNIAIDANIVSAISQPTQLDLWSARVIALDLAESTANNSAIIYMLAINILTRDFYLTEENLVNIPECYKAYYKQLILEINKDQKRIVFSELHKVAKIAPLYKQIIDSVHECKKCRAQVALLSSSIEDFAPEIVKLATSIFIMDAGSKKHSVEEVFALSQTDKNALYNCNERTFFAKFITKNGVNTQMLTISLGPKELWAFNVDPDDNAIREQLYKKIGSVEARRVLATLFPFGTIKKYLENGLFNFKKKGNVVNFNIKLLVIEKLVKYITDEYSKDPNFTGISKTCYDSIFESLIKQ